MTSTITPTITLTITPTTPPPVLYVICLIDSRGNWTVWTEATRDDADVCLDACGEDDVRRQLWHGKDLLKDQMLIDDDDDEEGVWVDFEDHLSPRSRELQDFKSRSEMSIIG